MTTLKTADDDTASRDETKHTAALSADVLPHTAIDGDTVATMYRLYAASYADTSLEHFLSDFADKTHVLLLSEGGGDLCGFSTLQVYTSEAPGQPVRVIYSGDTIIEPRHWGNSALAFEWLRFAGRTSREDAGLPLYWLLLVKGHRTYRYLSTFALHYVPHHARAASADETALMNTLAAEKFADCFDAESGIVRFGPQSGRLSAGLAAIPDKHRRLAAVSYFLELNPGYANGDELVCLCRLADDNLKPFTRRVFTSQ